MIERPTMDPVKFKPLTSGVKGGVGVAIVFLSLYLQAQVTPHIPGDILSKFPENTVAITIGGGLASAWNGLKFWLKRRKRKA